MIYDGFTFFNEVDLLELRLEIMNDYVEKFIIVESRKTFTNKDKELNYEKNKERFKKWEDKIEYIVIDEFPKYCKTAWDCEHYQRNAISKGLKNAKDDDILIVSDLDEIISPFGLKRIKSLLDKDPKQVLKLELLNCWYFLNYADFDCFFWGAPVAYKIAQIKELPPQDARSYEWNDCTVVCCAGWHFTYMGGIDRIKNKIKSFSHQEYNTEEWLDDNRIINTIKSGKDLFDREIATFGSIPTNSSLLPKPVLNDKEKYSKYLCDFNPMPKNRYIKLILKYLLEITPLRNIYHKTKELIKK